MVEENVHATNIAGHQDEEEDGQSMQSVKLEFTDGHDEGDEEQPLKMDLTAARDVGDDNIESAMDIQINVVAVAEEERDTEL